jgi:hypothetical protein
MSATGASRGESLNVGFRLKHVMTSVTIPCPGIGGEVFEHVDSDVHADSRDSEEMALKTAEKLLKVRIVSRTLRDLRKKGTIYSSGS